jgi:hypothetical protein
MDNMTANVIKYLILLPIMVSWSCSYNKLDSVEPASQNILMQDTISFSKSVVPIFVNNCNTSDCHSGTYPAANLNLEPSYAYAQLTRTGSGYVNTTNPENSRLYKSLISNMPPMGKLDATTIELITKWMQQAKNN